MKRNRSDFKWRHFEPTIILLCVRWYCRYSLSYRNLEEMMSERGLGVDHSTIFRWVRALCTRDQQADASSPEADWRLVPSG